MRCPFCGHDEDRVVDSRVSSGGEKIRRRRECTECARRYTTYERIEEPFPKVVKSDGTREEYDCEKVLHGVRLACVKRPISIKEIERVVDNVEAKLLELGRREVKSDWIGSAVTEELKHLDPVAYIRFASVYRAFADIQEFLAELKGLDEESDEADADA